MSSLNAHSDQVQQSIASSVMAEQPSDDHDEPKPESEESEPADQLGGDISNYL